MPWKRLRNANHPHNSLLGIILTDPLVVVGAVVVVVVVVMTGSIIIMSGAVGFVEKLATLNDSVL